MSAPKLQLHGGPISPFVRKVGLTILEKGIEKGVECVRSPTAMLEPNLKLMPYNPLSKIPTLILEDGSALYDSDVICDYLDFRFPTPRLFPPREQSWRARTWNALASGGLDALVLWRFERMRTPVQQNARLLEAYAFKLSAILERMEKEIEMLERAPFGIGHIAFGSFFGYLDFRFADIEWRTGHVHCAAWFQVFMNRSAAQRTVPYEGKAPPNHLWS